VNPGTGQANSLRRKQQSYQWIITAELLAGCLAWCFGFYFLIFVANGIEFSESRIVERFVPWFLFVGGTAVYLLGFYQWARAKGRSGKWALVGMIPFIGLLIMGCLGQRYPDGIREAESAPLGRSFGIGLFFLIGFIASIAAIQFPMEVARIRGFCDRAAYLDLENLGVALKKLADERTGSNCDSEPISGDIIEFMVGPYYGWEGTSRKLAGPYYGLKTTAAKPQILMRVEGDEVCACALKGARYGGADSHLIHRISLKDGRELPYKNGPCTGKSYGGPGAVCYTESIVNPDCKFRKPHGAPCEESGKRDLRKRTRSSQ
jgi:hypothetical protein